MQLSSGCCAVLTLAAGHHELQREQRDEHSTRAQQQRSALAITAICDLSSLDGEHDEDRELVFVQCSLSRRCWHGSRKARPRPCGTSSIARWRQSRRLMIPSGALILGSWKNKRTTLLSASTAPFTGVMSCMVNASMSSSGLVDVDGSRLKRRSEQSSAQLRP